MAATVRLGLTGGIGSGKSTVARFFADMGAVVVDADAISRSVTARDGAAMEGIVTAFGTIALTQDGALNRDVVRQLIFSNASAKSTLESIVHPLVAQEIERQAQAAERSLVACVVFDIPLLVESSRWRNRLTRVVVVDCSERTQLERVTQRNGLSPAEVEKIIAAQAPRGYRLSAADLVLFNEGVTLDRLGQQVHEIGTQFGL